MCKPGLGPRVLQGRVCLDLGAVFWSKDLRQSTVRVRELGASQTEFQVGSDIY